MTTSVREGVGSTLRVAAFAAILAVVFGGAWAAGAQVGPLGAKQSAHQEDDMNDTATPHSGSLPGLAAAQDGYRLVLGATTIEPGTRQVTFTIEGPDGRPVTAFDVEHEKKLHLILVRRDHIGFQHLHPRLDESTGTWSAEAQLTPGPWRVFADFTATDGPALVLGSDLLVPGELEAAAPAEESRTDVVDGYTVLVDGTVRPGKHALLTLAVTRHGAPVTDLQPYLGAYGHLVALREGDLAYLHVHPGGEPGDGVTRSGPEIEFGVEVPSTGRYHLYLDFRHDDVVRTAHFVLDAGSRVGTGRDSEPGKHGDAAHIH